MKKEAIYKNVTSVIFENGVTKVCWEEPKWRAPKNSQYETVDLTCIGATVAQITDLGRAVDNFRYGSGNYFNPETKDAEKAAEEVNKIFERNL